MKPTSKRVVGGSVGVAASAILAAVLAVEGGFVDNPMDPGGPTNHGVTQRVARAHGYMGPMQDLSVEQARQILYDDYIVKPGFEPLLESSPAVAEEIVDSAVNVGPAQATRWLQRSLNALSADGRDYPVLPVDGVVGPRTVADYAALQYRRGPGKACEWTLKLMDAQQAVYYMGLPSAPTFLPGWIDKRVENVPLSRCAAQAAP